MTPTKQEQSPAPAPLFHRVFGLNLSLLALHDLLEELLNIDPTAGGSKLIATVNVDHVVTLRSDRRFRDAYNNAWRVTVDGTPVYLYARAHGVPLPERVTGADLFAALVKRWDPDRHRLYMLVPSEEAAARMGRIMRERGYDEETLAIEVPPFGFEKDPDYSNALTARIRALRPTHVILGVGAPKSEIWAHEHRHELGDSFVLCVGAAVEFVTGLKKRSPLIMRRFGMEWIWRFGTEPRRLFYRYFVRSFGFLLAVLDDLPRTGRLQARHD